MNPEVVYPVAAEEAFVVEPPAEYQSFTLVAEVLLGAGAGAAQLELPILVAEDLAGDPQSSQLSLSVVSVVPAVVAGVGADDAYGFAAPAPVPILLLPAVALEL